MFLGSVTRNSVNVTKDNWGIFFFTISCIDSRPWIHKISTQGWGLYFLYILLGSEKGPRIFICPEKYFSHRISRNYRIEVFILYRSWKTFETCQTSYSAATIYTTLLYPSEPIGIVNSFSKIWLYFGNVNGKNLYHAPRSVQPISQLQELVDLTHSMVCYRHIFRC